MYLEKRIRVFSYIDDDFVMVGDGDEKAKLRKEDFEKDFEILSEDKSTRTGECTITDEASERVNDKFQFVVEVAGPILLLLEEKARSNTMDMSNTFEFTALIKMYLDTFHKGESDISKQSEAAMELRVLFTKLYVPMLIKCKILGATFTSAISPLAYKCAISPEALTSAVFPYIIKKQRQREASLRAQRELDRKIEEREKASKVTLGDLMKAKGIDLSKLKVK